MKFKKRIMQNKFFFNGVKNIAYAGIVVSALLLAQLYSGCSGSEETTDQRTVDSIGVYTGLQKAFAMYKKALSYNESDNTEKAAQSFELSLKYLKEIDFEVVNHAGNYFWKQDYDELAKSIVEDYLTTQPEINSKSLVFEFAKRVSLGYEKVEHVSNDRAPLPDGSDIPLIRNSYVDEYIDFFSKTDRGRSFIDKCLYRSGKYFPLMRKILKFNNAPEELIYLSVQESGLSPTIVSRAGAVGLWQFMPTTGSSYGLYQDGYHDDRRDFEKSTDAAARHLKDLYRTFDDWYLAFSAYNAGPGRVNSAIRKSGSNDFWVLRNYLPGETKNYVPSILALSFVLRNPEEYGFNDVEYGTPLSFDRVNINSDISLQRVAELCETDIESIRDLNPELTSDALPQYGTDYQLRIPEGSYKKFAANYKNASDIVQNGVPEFAGNEIGGYGSSTAFTSYKVENYEPDDVRTIASTKTRMKVVHEFRVNQPLTAVAAFYDVRPVEIRIWNNLSYGENPKSSQKLEIYVSEEKYKRLHGDALSEPENKVASIEDIESAPVQTEAPKNDNSTVQASDDNVSVVNNQTVKTDTDYPSTDSETQIENSSATDNSTISENQVEDVSQTENDNTTQVENENESQSENENDNRTEEIEPVKKGDVVKGNATSYKVAEGDNLTSIAAKNNVTVQQLKEWNNLEDDKILTGQTLIVNQGKPKKSATTYHVVTEGETLTTIANQYDVSVSDIMEFNNLKSDLIYKGQKLRLYEVEKKNTTSGSKKIHKVKKGETLASIAGDNGVTVENILNWNDLKSDKIFVGQSLKLYGEQKIPKKKIRRKKAG